MANRDIVAIGTSAGGVEALLFLAKNFPKALPASVFVTIHLSSHFNSSLDELLTRAGKLPATFAKDGEPIRKGRIYLAPAGFHMLIEGDTIALGNGPRENNVCPAIDPMLRSLAACCGPRSVGVILTGTMGDGASGLWALGRYGGVTVVQEPKDAAFPEMPLTALKRARPDRVVPLADMPKLLESLVQRPAGEPVPEPVPKSLRYEVEIAKHGHSDMSHMDAMGRRSRLSCPDCGGVMWEIDDGDGVRFRCHIGHAYTAEVMSMAMDESLRHALASAQRGYEERAALLERMHARASGQGQSHLAETWRQKADEYSAEADVILDAIKRLDRLATAPAPE